MKIHHWNFEEKTKIWFSSDEGPSHHEQIIGPVFMIELSEDEYNKLAKDLLEAAIIDPVRGALHEIFKDITSRR